jgi:hypothetical protein
MRLVILIVSLVCTARQANAVLLTHLHRLRALRHRPARATARLHPLLRLTQYTQLHVGANSMVARLCHRKWFSATPSNHDRTEKGKLYSSICENVD